MAMKMNEKFYVIIILIGLPLLIYVFFFSQKQSKLYSELDKEGIVDTAIVVRDFIGAKRKLYYEYVFYVNNKNYNGFLQYSPSCGSISIGDSFLVKYLPKEPDEINELIRGKDHQIIKVK
jgi:hypothetical protein